MTRPSPKSKGNSSERVRNWTGPAILSYGYRPFFLLAGIWAVIAMSLWVAFLAGWISLNSRFDPVSWHAHEMLFGFLGAVLAGFLLTAVPNWTGRLPIIGWPLAGLVVLWIGGRVAIALFQGVSPVLVGVIDLSFLTTLAIAIAREITAGKNWRNLPLLTLLAVIIVGNLLYHVGAAKGEYAAGGLGFRMGLAAAIMLVSLIGGRVVPSFTRNWLVKHNRDTLPVPFSNVDRFALISALIALASWTGMPDHTATAALCALAGLANLFRLSRWSGLKVTLEPLLWILHIGYLFVPLGFLSIAASSEAVGFGPRLGAQHFWMAGAVGVMSLAMMTRASLGHSGRPIQATLPITFVYVLVIASVVLRYVSSIGGVPAWVAHASAISWICGFAGFSLVYWPILTKPRR